MRRSQAGCKKVSQFGQYHGYSEAIYHGYQRRSQYLALEDGVRLAEEHALSRLRRSHGRAAGTSAPWGAVLAAGEYSNMRDNDEKALTYTTLPMETGVELTDSSSGCRQSTAVEPISTGEMISLAMLAAAALQEEG